jgi:hypothetical protein
VPPPPTTSTCCSPVQGPTTWRCSSPDDCQHLGIGTLLPEHLTAVARRVGVTCFEAYVLGHNSMVCDVFRRSGFA